MEQSFVSLLAETCKCSFPENTEFGNRWRDTGAHGKTSVHMFLFKLHVGK